MYISCTVSINPACIYCIHAYTVHNHPFHVYPLNIYVLCTICIVYNLQKLLTCLWHDRFFVTGSEWVRVLACVYIVDQYSSFWYYWIWSKHFFPSSPIHRPSWRLRERATLAHQRPYERVELSCPWLHLPPFPDSARRSPRRRQLACIMHSILGLTQNIHVKAAQMLWFLVS